MDYGNCDRFGIAAGTGCYSCQPVDGAHRGRVGGPM